MNFGQVLEATVSKVIDHCENRIIQDPNEAPELLKKIAKISSIIGDDEYAQLIDNLADNIKVDSIYKDAFRRSIEEDGLYFEAPNFSKFDNIELEDYIQKEFGLSTNEPIMYKRELIEYMNKFFDCDLPVPETDIILDNIFVSYIYTLKLKQEAHDRLTARDFGNYKAELIGPSKSNLSRKPGEFREHPTCNDEENSEPSLVEPLMKLGRCNDYRKHIYL